MATEPRELPVHRVENGVQVHERDAGQHQWGGSECDEGTRAKTDNDVGHADLVWRNAQRSQRRGEVDRHPPRKDRVVCVVGAPLDGAAELGDCRQGEFLCFAPRLRTAAGIGAVGLPPLCTASPSLRSSCAGPKVARFGRAGQVHPAGAWASCQDPLRPPAARRAGPIIQANRRRTSFASRCASRGDRVDSARPRC